MKTNIIRTLSVVTNLLIGAVSVIFYAVFYGFVFDKEDVKDHSIQLGSFTLLMWLFILLAPNLLFRILGLDKKRDMLTFQLIPLIVGAVVNTLYSVF